MGFWRKIIEAMRNARLKREAIEWTDSGKVDVLLPPDGHEFVVDDIPNHGA